MNLAQTSFNGGEISPELYNRSDFKKWPSSCRVMENFMPRIRGSAENRPGTIFVHESKDSSKRARLYKFQFSVVQWYMLEFGHNYIRFFKDDGIIVSGMTIVEVVTTYTEAELPLLKFEQSADVLYIFHPSHTTAKLTRTSHTSWTLTDVVNGAPIAAPASFARSAGAATGFDYAVSAVNSSGLESILSNIELNRGHGDTFTWTAVTGASYYNIYERTNGSWARIGKALTNTYVVAATPTRDSTVIPKEANTPFSGTGNKPGVGAFYDQRLYSARTNNKPSTLFGSVVGDFDNQNKSIPAADDDALQFTISANSVNEIRGLAALDSLVILTSDGISRMRAGTNADAITPSSVDLKQQSRYGCSHRPPLIIDDGILFVDGSEARIRDLGYSLERDGYIGDDLTILAEHIFETYKVYEWDFQRYPDTVVWVVREDGTACALTYQKKQEVYGWSRHTTQGTFESVSSVVTADGESQVWFIVKRTINGQTKRYVERLSDRRFTEIEDAFFVDCGLTYSGVPADTISGLEHLEGMEVAVFADGSVVDGLTVQSGAITLPFEASKVHIGLGYTCTLQNIGFDVETPAGRLQDFQRQIVKVIAKLRNTRELFVASLPGGEYFETPFRENENYGEPTALFSGDKEVFVSPSGSRSALLSLQVRNPVPCTVESLTATIQPGDIE